jgi:hypothetical protein
MMRGGVTMAKFEVTMDHHAHFIITDASETITAGDIEQKLRDIVSVIRPGDDPDSEETLSIVVVAFNQ